MSENDNMIFGYDKDEIREIAKASQSKGVRNAVSTIRQHVHFSPDKVVCEYIPGKCFYAGVANKQHFRLLEIAVAKKEQRNGLGTMMLRRIKTMCRTRGLSKITLRTSKEETAWVFYKKHGGKITSEKDGDYEMEIPV